jgi:hypothetical protein
MQSSPISPLGKHNVDQHSINPDFTLAPAQTLQQKEELRLQKLKNFKNLTYREQTTTGANIVQMRAPTDCNCYQHSQSPSLINNNLSPSAKSHLAYAH